MQDFHKLKKRLKCPICESAIGEYDRLAETVWCSNKGCKLHEEEVDISLWELFNDAK